MEKQLKHGIPMTQRFHRIKKPQPHSSVYTLHDKEKYQRLKEFLLCDQCPIILLSLV